MPFKYVEDTAIADIAVDISGENLEQVFADAARSLTDGMVDPSALSGSSKRHVTLESDDLEGLLYDWLAELIYLKDVEQELFGEFSVTITQSESKAGLQASFRGTPIADVLPNLLRNDVKAVTMHQFKLVETEEGFRARVVFDI